LNARNKNHWANTIAGAVRQSATSHVPFVVEFTYSMKAKVALAKTEKIHQVMLYPLR
jgi:hypothetical protein